MLTSLFIAFIHLIKNVISLINFGLFVWIILGLLFYFNVISRKNSMVTRVYDLLERVFEPLLRPIRRQLNRWLPHMEIDLSPVVFMLLLLFIDNFISGWTRSFLIMHSEV